MMINNYADCAGNRYECDSSEDMRASFEEYNDSEIEDKEMFRIVSMDIKALFPSMKWVYIIKAVRDMIEESDMNIEDVDWHEVGKYLVVMLSKGEIEQEGLNHVVPKRKSNRNITINYLQDKKNDKNWNRGRKPGRLQKNVGFNHFHRCSASLGKPHLQSWGYNLSPDSRGSYWA